MAVLLKEHLGLKTFLLRVFSHFMHLTPISVWKSNGLSTTLGTHSNQSCRVSPTHDQMPCKHFWLIEIDQS